jgi:hypothetical protein
MKLSLLISLTLPCAITPLEFADTFANNFRNDQSPRALQTSGGPLPDLIAPTSECYVIGGLSFACLLHQRVGNQADYVDLNITVKCALGLAQTDFRRADGCGCSVLITPSNTSKLPKTCMCTVCPKNFGSSSVSMDCSNLIPTIAPASQAPTAGNFSGGSSMAPRASTPKTTMAPRVSTPKTTMAPSLRTPGISKAPSANSSSVSSKAPSSIISGNSSTSVNGTNGTHHRTPSSSSKAPTRIITGNSSTSINGTNGTHHRDLQAFGTTTTSSAAPTAASKTIISANMTTGRNSTANMTTNSTGPVPDPYIFSTCTSIDCGGACNGTCSIG